MKKLIEVAIPARDNNIYLIEADAVIMNAEEEDTIVFDNLVIKENGTVMTEFGKSWHGRFTKEEVGSELIRYCINGIPEVEVRCIYHPQIEELRKKYSEGAISAAGVTRNLKYMGAFGDLDLQMIDNDGFAYYQSEDEYILLRKDGSIATDQEYRYDNEFIEVLENGTYAYTAEWVIT